MVAETKEWINYIRVIATISVLFLHVAAEIPTLYGEVPINTWWIGNLVDSSVRFCVPLFIMISGALLLGKKMNTIDFLKKRVTRVLFPFLFWSFVYIAVNVLFKLYTGKEIYILEYVLKQLRYGSANHLWFVYMILGLYLFIPILNVWINNSTPNDLKYYLIIWLITLFSALPFQLVFGFNIDLYYFSGFLGYLILGYYLSKLNIKITKFSKANLYFIYFTGFIITSLGTYYLTQKELSFNESLYEYLTPNVMLMSVAVFLLIKDTMVTNKFLTKVIFLINKYSYGIFLIHILVLILLRKLSFYWAFLNPALSIPLVVAVCLSISLAIVYVTNKIPFGKYISG
jgi:surface polysaccharide O-acyltransferase-like enzyme